MARTFTYQYPNGSTDYEDDPNDEIAIPNAGDTITRHGHNYIVDGVNLIQGQVTNVIVMLRD